MGELAATYDRRAENALADADAATYGSQRMPLHVSAPYRFAEARLRQYRAAGATSLLDLCCGVGVHSVAAASLGFSVTGVDISPGSIEAARWLAEVNGLADRCRFEVNDGIRFLAVDGERFDCILISGSLYYLDLASVCRTVPLRLLPGGHFLAIETNGGNRLMAVARRIRAALRGDRDRQTLERLLGTSQLADLAAVFPASRLTLFDCLTLFGVFLRPFPGRLRASYQGSAARADRRLLKHDWARSIAFKWIFEGEVGGQLSPPQAAAPRSVPS